MVRIAIVWLHVLAATVWLGGTIYSMHLVVPPLARGERAYLPLLGRARMAAWAALGLLVVTGLENLRHVRLDSPWVMAKLLLVLALLALAAHRDFALVPRATRAVGQGTQPAVAMAGVRWLDRVTVLLGVVILFLGVAIARGR